MIVFIFSVKFKAIRSENSAVSREVSHILTVFGKIILYLGKTIVGLKISFEKKFVLRKLVGKSQILPILGKIIAHLRKRQKKRILKLPVVKNCAIY